MNLVLIFSTSKNHNFIQYLAVYDIESKCDNVRCFESCPYGYKTDRHDCPTCDCVPHPCESLVCPNGSTCEMVSDPSCANSERVGHCPLKPTCLSDSLFVNPCPLGTPLTDIESKQVVTCSENSHTCPSSHICVVVSVNKAGLCCVNRPRIGELDFLLASIIAFSW